MEILDGKREEIITLHNRIGRASILAVLLFLDYDSKY